MTGFERRFSRIEGNFSQARRLPRLGKIRLGLKKLSAKGVEYPTETDYFVCPPEVQAIYGTAPKELDVMLPLNDPTIVFPQQYAWYGKGKGLKCHGNGVEAERYHEEKKEWFLMKCPCEQLKSDENPKGECTEQADLLFILPKVNMGGVYQLTTRSYNSVVDINSGLDYTQALVGRIALVPLKLRRVERITHYDDPKSGRVSRKHYTLTLGLDADAEGINVLRQHTDRVITDTRLLSVQLPAPAMENPEDDLVDEVEQETAEHPAPAPAPKSRIDALKEKLGSQVEETVQPAPAPPVADGPDEIPILLNCLQATSEGCLRMREILNNFGLPSREFRPAKEDELTLYREALREALDGLMKKAGKA